MKHVSRLLFALAIAAAPAAAHAETPATAPPSDAAVQEARQRFLKGVDLYKDGSFDAALAEFEKAYELAPNYRVLYNLAQTQTERHDYVAALGSFQQYLEQGDSELSTERKDTVARQIAVLKTRVAQLDVHADVDGAELLIDGVSAGTTPFREPVLVNAGVRQVKLQKAGYETSTRTPTIAGGESVRLDFTLPKQVVLAASGGGRSLPAHRELGEEGVSEGTTATTRSSTPMWISLAATGAFAGGAIAFGVLANQRSRDLDRELDRMPANPGDIDDARSGMRRDALISDCFTAAAVVSGGAFLYFALSGSSSHGAEARTRMRVAPSGTGLRVFGNF